MKKQLLSLLSFIALALLATGVSHSSERLATPQPIDAAAEATAPANVPPLCAARGKNCGLIDDECGGKIDCGPCTGPNTCGGSGVPNVCGCTPRTCGAQQCGFIDPGCGRPRLSCGSCPAGQLCNVRGLCVDQPPGDRCPCGGRPPFCQICPESAQPPALCVERGKNCGVIDDGHGKKVDCGTCKGSDTCGGGGVPNVCGGPRKK